MNNSYYIDLIKKLDDVPILVFGDTMLDRFIFGSVDRISPEAPVPIVKTKLERFVPGGAGNVVQNISAFGATPYLVTVEGGDVFSELLLKQYDKKVNLDGVIRNPERNTILKTRIIGNDQQIVRVDVEQKHVFSEENIDEIKSKILGIIDKVRTIVISDYGKGMVDKNILDFLIKEAKKRHIIILVDPKIENFKLYKNVTCITPNLSEAKQGMNELGILPDDNVKIENLGFDIKKFLNSDSVLITRSEFGMSLFEGNKVYHIASSAKEVYDVTGAGDTVISVLAVCLANGLSLYDSAFIANFVAGVVVGKIGTAVVKKDEIIERMKVELN